ncbi:hypothetical protein [Paraburkholderia jirisanensis]
MRYVLSDLANIGNRNAALACWFDGSRSTLTSETILANPIVMMDELTTPRYHEEVTATRASEAGGVERA